jgi:uncharacterized protein
MSVVRYDQGAWPEKAEVTPDGFLRVDAPITRLGVLQYRNADGSPRGELRHPDDWAAPLALASLASLPITDGHPPPRQSDGLPLVDARNAKRLAIGWTGEAVRAEGAFLRTPMMIVDAAGVAAVQRGRRGTSTGVIVDLREEQGTHDGVAYQYRQVNPRGNHIAIVDSPRAGTMIRVDGNQDDDSGAAAEGDKHMVKVTLDGISYDAAPEVANALTKAQALGADLTLKLDAAAAASKAAVDKLTAERDAHKEKLDAAEKRDVRAEVRARVALETAARQVLPEAEHAKLDAMDDAAVRKAVVAATWPALKLDDKSPDYIAQRYDIALEDRGHKAADDKAHDEALGAQRAALAHRQDSSGGANDLDAAAKKASERISNQWKPKAA